MRRKVDEGARVVGDVVMEPLAKVKPNTWNPNEMTLSQMESMKHGFLTDGWLKSQALLVWRKDEKGKLRNVIIDGEHRWLTANALAMKEGPMVFLDGLTEAQAKKLTIKMDAKRGAFNQDKLGELLRQIQNEVDSATESLGRDLGLEDAHVMRLLAETSHDLPGSKDAPEPPPGTVDMPAGKMEHVKMVQLFFDEKQHDEFMAIVTTLSKKHATKNVTDTVLEGLRSVRPSSTAS